jgi:hypothetical protein
MPKLSDTGSRTLPGSNGARRDPRGAPSADTYPPAGAGIAGTEPDNDADDQGGPQTLDDWADDMHPVPARPRR